MTRARELLSEIPAKAKGTSNFAIVNEAGVASEQYNQACHRQIGNTELRDRCLVVTEAGWKRRKKAPISRELAALYADYIVNKFYAGRFVLNQDPDEWLDGGFIVSCDAPAPLLQNFCIASRAFFEVTSASFEKFRELLDGGIHPDVAYICCFSTAASHPALDFEGDTRAIEDAHPVAQGAGHRPHRLLPLGALSRMIRGEVGPAYTKPLDGSETHRTVASYQGGSTVFDDRSVLGHYGTLGGSAADMIKDLLALDEFKVQLSEFRKANAASETYRPPNPFVRSPAALRPDQMSNREFYTLAVPFVNEYVQREATSERKAA